MRAPLDRVTLGEWETVARVEPDATLVHLGHDAVTDPFNFEYPASTIKGLVNQPGQHGRRDDLLAPLRGIWLSGNDNNLPT